MKCIYCGNNGSEVRESREVEEGEAIRRRRECIKCHRRFTSYERAREISIWVVKKDGRREPFDKEKVRRGVLRAIEKRPVSLTLADEVVERVERQVLKKHKEEVPSREIGNAVLKELKKVDRVAWLRFASVYLEFEDLSDFEKAIEKMT